MHQDILIEQMKLSKREELLAFLSGAYADNPRHSDKEFWDWHFPESPYCDSEDLPIWIARSEGKIVGHLAATPVEFNVDGEVVRAIWILDLIIDPSFRRRGIAKRLALASKEFCPYVLGVNTSAQHSTELLAELGWKIFAKIPRYQRILFPGNAVKEIAGVKPLRGLANTVWSPLRPNAKQTAGVSRPASFDERFDDLWREARTQWPCSISRNAVMLDWQFRCQPGKEFEVLAFESDGKLLGYAVLFFRKADTNGVISKGAISDICYHPDNAAATVDALINGVLWRAIERRAGSLVTDAIDDLLEQQLRANGFRSVKSSLQLLANVPQRQDIVYDKRNWFLTRGDADISIFEDPNR